VADRTPVDWVDEAARTPDRAPALDRLREIAALHAVHGRLVHGEPGPGALFSWGPLEVLERIGQGSFAEVFRARDPALQREVALKLRRADLDRSSLGARRWIEEARRLARVRHPNVLVVHGADEHDGRAGLWTELLRGATLEDSLGSHGTLGPREAAGLGIDLCGAVAAVHAAGLVHGDVTTRNVMREGGVGAPDGSGRIVLMDFGSAHDARAADLIAFGTPLFTAPEVLEGESPSARSDVYSLGVVLYRMLTGRYPVDGESMQRIRERLSRGERVALRDARPALPSDLVLAVERACALDPARRFASPAELEQALANALPAPARPARRAPVPRWALAAAAVVAVALTAAALLGPRSRGGSETSRTGGPAAAVPPPGVASGSGAPAAAPPAEPAAAAVPEVDAVLYRVTGGSREALRTGDLVAPGDQLSLEIESRTAVHVYVLSEDERGEVFVLFPLGGRGAANPLAPGRRHRLPGREGDADLDWQVTSAGGRERFLILASPEPLRPVTEATAAFPEARPDAPVAHPALPPEALARLRGVGGVARGTPLRPDADAGILSALARDLSRPRAGRAIWMRLIVLENPIP
jgi:tRNA A-37 threonylcarbamoyl transferase component Bud32